MEYRCKICGKLAEEDAHFYKTKCYVIGITFKCIVMEKSWTPSRAAF